MRSKKAAMEGVHVDLMQFVSGDDIGAVGTGVLCFSVTRVAGVTHDRNGNAEDRKR